VTGILGDGAVKGRVRPPRGAEIVELRPVADDVQADAQLARRRATTRSTRL
jgi:hypothetical protein